MLKNIRLKIIFTIALFLFLPFLVSAFSVGDIENFYVEDYYDIYQRKEASFLLVRITNDLLFYIENDWWNSLDSIEKSKTNYSLISLGNNFSQKIYPKLTYLFGNIPNHPVDKSGRISIVFHQMRRDAGGYFRTGDQYLKLEYPMSNQKNMLYLNINRIDEHLLPAYLAHELIHLITFNQKQKLNNISEEVWLEELRAELAPSLLGYDKNYQNSYLKIRVENFLSNPKESLVRWRNRLSDYGIINIFGQYLIDHYGVELLSQSLFSDKKGIESLENFLVQEDFRQVFINWAITLALNDCNLGERYCYLNPNLKNLKITSDTYYLSKEEPLLRLSGSIFNWSASWNKIVGASGDLFLNVQGDKDIIVSYLLCDYQERCQVYFLEPKDGPQKAIFLNFDKDYNYLIVIPIFAPKNNPDTARTFNLSLSLEMQESKNRQENEVISLLLAQLESLKRQISEYQAKINAILFSRGEDIICREIYLDLYFGMRNSQEVSCLQKFLKDQGPEIYPEGLITGNFLSLTKEAVIRFQEKYAQEILYPLDFKSGTGYVGSATREKINSLLK